MAINVNDIINVSNINNGFTQVVMDIILANTYDINNIPIDGSYYCIQPDRLGNKSSLPVPSVAVSGTTISAANIYNNLVALTSTLTRVGTWSYMRTYDNAGTTELRYSVSGKALFNDSYIKTLSSVNNANVASGEIISAAGINTLLANLLTAWKNTSKHHNSITNSLCHTDCHTDCHSDCHSDCDCYK